MSTTCVRMDALQAHHRAARAEAQWERPAAGILGRILRTLRIWRLRSVTRRELLELDERLLADVGIKRADALMEASKPFWRP